MQVPGNVRVMLWGMQQKYILFKSNDREFSQLNTKNNIFFKNT